MNVLCENIGVDDKGNWKYSCPSCHNIILTKEKKESISCPECQFVPGTAFQEYEKVDSDLTYGALDEEFDFETLNPWRRKHSPILVAYFVATGVLANIIGAIMLLLWILGLK